MALQGSLTTAQGQSFVGHSDSVTGLAWADPATLITTGAGDAVLIWRLTPAAIEEACRSLAQPPTTSDSQPLLQATLPEASAAGPAVDRTPAFKGFHPAGEQSSMWQSLEAAAGLLQSQAQAQAQAQATDPTAATLAAAPALQTDPSAATSPPAQSAQLAGGANVVDLPASQHQLLATLGNRVLQQQEGVHSIPAGAGLHLERVVGFNGGQHSCCVLQEQGLLVYATDQFLVLEQLASREQR